MLLLQLLQTKSEARHADEDQEYVEKGNSLSLLYVSPQMGSR